MSTMMKSAIGLGVLSLTGLFSLDSEIHAQATPPAPVLIAPAPVAAPSIWARLLAPRSRVVPTPSRRNTNPPFYSGAQHSQHGRGWDASRHGR